MRRLAAALGLTVLLTPAVGQALGLGKIDLKSGLNQTLNAEIKLLSVNEAELPDIKVTLATSEAFNRVGVDRNYFLTQLKFKATIGADGRPVISVKTRDAVKEPFLNFLIEVNWPQGRFLREYTLLLDPPVTFEKEEPIVLTVPKKTVSRQGTIRKANSSASTSSSSGNANANANGSVKYKTKRGDTLGKIAKRHSGGSTSLKQVMMGVFEANPEAFVDNNINKMKSGQILKIPSEAELASVSQADAAQSFRQQTSDWRQQKAESESEEVDFEAESTFERPVIEQEETTGQDVIRVDTPTSDDIDNANALPGESADISDIPTLKRNFRLANEAAASQERENVDLRSRVETLSDQVNKMERLIGLQNAEMASLQQRLVEQGLELPDELKAQLDAISEQAVSNDTGEIALDSTDELSLDNDVTDLAAEDNNDNYEDAETEKSGGMVDDALKMAGNAADMVMKQVKPLLDNPIALGGIGAGVVVFFILIMLIMRRRKAGKHEESILATDGDYEVGETIITSSEAPSSDIQVDEGYEADSAYESDLVDDESFLSDITPSDMTTMMSESDEASEPAAPASEADTDPLAEADVYLAYGRYDQSEDLIAQAIEDAPERVDYKVKLLEVYYAIKDQAKFEQLAEDVHGSVSGEDKALWDRVVTMGADLSPGHPLFEVSQPTDSMSDDVATVAAIDEIDALGIEADETRNLFEEETKVMPEGEVDLGDGLDFGGLDDGLSEDLTAGLDSDDLSGLGDISALDSSDDLMTGLDIGDIEDSVTDDGLSGIGDIDLSGSDDSLAGIGEIDLTGSDDELADFGDIDLSGSDDALGGIDLGDSLSGLEDTPSEVAEPEESFSTDSFVGSDSFAEEDDFSASVSAFDESTPSTSIDSAMSKADDIGDISASLNAVGEEPVAAVDDIQIDLTDEMAESLSADDLGFDLDSVDLSDDVFNTDQSIDLGGTEAAVPDEVEVSAADDVGDALAIGDDVSTNEEIETKLELARVYVDMGDPEGAQDILKEVMEEGSDEQKEMAKDILGGL